MSNQPNKGQSNRGKKRRAERESRRIPGRGAGQPIPTRTPGGQPSVTSLADLAKAGGGQVPLSIPQLMAKVGSLTVERDFWMNAAVNLEEQVSTLTGGGAVPSVEDVAAAEEEIQDIPVTVTKCPECGVTIGPEDEFIDAEHAEGCEFEGAAFASDGEEATPSPDPTVPPETLLSELTVEEQAVVDEANAALAQQAAADEGRPSPLEEEAPE